MTVLLVQNACSNEGAALVAATTVADKALANNQIRR